MGTLALPIVDERIRVVGIRVREKGKIIQCDAGDLDLQEGEPVFFEGDEGEKTLGWVWYPPRPMGCVCHRPQRRVLRKLTDKERERLQRLQGIEAEAAQYCLQRIEARGLPMKLVEVEYRFHENKILFYFTADGRVDFRELVKDLAYKFRARIEMRQIGVRDGARMLDGYGPCGRPLCCSTFLMEFTPVSIRMAREQDLVLNPMKTSGMCGRLKCCIAFEHGMPREAGYADQESQVLPPVPPEEGEARVAAVPLASRDQEGTSLPTSQTSDSGGNGSPIRSERRRRRRRRRRVPGTSAQTGRPS